MTISKSTSNSIHSTTSGRSANAAPPGGSNSQPAGSHRSFEGMGALSSRQSMQYSTGGSASLTSRGSAGIPGSLSPAQTMPSPAGLPGSTSSYNTGTSGTGTAYSIHTDRYAPAPPGFSRSQRSVDAASPYSLTGNKSALYDRSQTGASSSLGNRSRWAPAPPSLIESQLGQHVNLDSPGSYARSLHHSVQDSAVRQSISDSWRSASVPAPFMSNFHIPPAENQHTQSGAAGAAYPSQIGAGHQSGTVTGGQHFVLNSEHPGASTSGQFLHANAGDLSSDPRALGSVSHTPVTATPSGLVNPGGERSAFQQYVAGSSISGPSNPPHPTLPPAPTPSIVGERAPSSRAANRLRSRRVRDEREFETIIRELENPHTTLAIIQKRGGGSRMRNHFMYSEGNISLTPNGVRHYSSTLSSSEYERLQGALSRRAHSRRGQDTGGASDAPGSSASVPARRQPGNLLPDLNAPAEDSED